MADGFRSRTGRKPDVDPVAPDVWLNLFIEREKATISPDTSGGSFHRRLPIMALALMTALFGLAGIPPTIGFTGKLFIFTAAMQKGYFAFVLIAMFNVVISLYYYLLLIRAAYLLDPAEGEGDLPAMPGANILAGTLVVAIVILGIYPTPLIDLIRAAALALG